MCPWESCYGQFERLSPIFLDHKARFLMMVMMEKKKIYRIKFLSSDTSIRCSQVFEQLSLIRAGWLIEIGPSSIWVLLALVIMEVLCRARADTYQFLQVGVDDGDPYRFQCPAGLVPIGFGARSTCYALKDFKVISSIFDRSTGVTSDTTSLNCSSKRCTIGITLEASYLRFVLASQLI